MQRGDEKRIGSLLNGGTDIEPIDVTQRIAVCKPKRRALSKPKRIAQRKSLCESDQQAVALAVETGRHVAADVKPERKAVVQPERVPLDVTLVESKRRGSLRRRLCGRAH